MAIQTIVLAGGCFWGMQELLRHVPGVKNTEVGYTGGGLSAPCYADVKQGDTGHAEAIRVVFNDAQLSLFDLLAVHFFRIHDPTTWHQQGNDRGSQYRSVIFYASEAQREIAYAAIDAVSESRLWPNAIVTEVLPMGEFWPAESEHQDYLQKYPNGYTCHFYR